VVDDLQWADAQSAAALRFVVRRLHAEPLLVILITRPHPADALGEAWARLLSDASRVVRVRLDGLTTDAMVELVAAAGHGHVARPVAERLRAHTHGNPLHARALVDELGEAALRAPGLLPAPRSFAQLTAARLAGLGVEAARLVAAGAVLGASFPLAAAASVGGVGDPVAALDRATTAGLLERTPDGEIRFAHPLVRGAVYNDLSGTQRRELHLAAAAMTTGARSLEHRAAATVGYDDELAAELEHLAGELAAGGASAAYDHLVIAAQHAPAAWMGVEHPVNAEPPRIPRAAGRPAHRWPRARDESAGGDLGGEGRGRRARPPHRGQRPTIVVRPRPAGPWPASSW